jgi:hypothetical protein
MVVGEKLLFMPEVKIAQSSRSTGFEDEVALAKPKWFPVAQTGSQERLKAGRRNRIILKYELYPLPTCFLHAVVPVGRDPEPARISDEAKPFISFRQLPGAIERAV